MLSGIKPERACCFDPWFSLHSHTFSHHIRIHPAVCADLIKSWFGFLEDGRKGYTDSQQSCISNEASTLLSSIQTGTGFIDTFDSTKITGHFLSPGGFRDNIELHLAPVASGDSLGTKISGVSYHDGHVCICLPLPIAFLCCCCNLCPTIDKGFNQLRVESLISFIRSKAPMASPSVGSTM